MTKIKSQIFNEVENEVVRFLGMTGEYYSLRVTLKICITSSKTYSDSNKMYTSSYYP